MKNHDALLLRTYKNVWKEKSWTFWVLTSIWSKRNPLILLVGIENVHLLWKTVWQFLTNIYRMTQAIPFLGSYPRTMKVEVCTNTCERMFTAYQHTNHATMRTTWMPWDAWEISQLAQICTTECYPSRKISELIHIRSCTSELRYPVRVIRTLKNYTSMASSKRQKGSYEDRWLSEDEKGPVWASVSGVTSLFCILIVEVAAQTCTCIIIHGSGGAWGG